MDNNALCIRAAASRGARILSAWLGALCIALPGFALAGGTATIESSTPDGPVRVDVSWADDNLRLDLPGQQNAYMLVRAGKGYSVASQAGRTMVLDMESMRQMGQMGGGGDPAEALGPDEVRSLDVLEATGERELVAGIAGEVYRIAWTDGAGDAQEGSAVLSGDARARALTDAFARSTQAISGRAEDPFGEAMRQRDLGMLRFGDQFQVVAISDDAPPASEFELPAEPMTLQDMMGGAGAR